MNCPVCLYEYEDEYINGSRRVLKGDRKFHEYMLISGDDSYPYELRDVAYCCPKCGIIFIPM